MTASYSEGGRTPIREIDVGDGISQTFLVTTAEADESSNGKPFVRMVLADRTGEVKAIQFGCGDAPEPGVCRVDGKVDEFKGNLQVKVTKCEAVEDGDPSDFAKASKYSKEELDDVLDDVLESVGGEYGDIVRSIFADDELREKFLAAPAALQNHHAYERGLAEHTLSMVHIARLVCSHYEDMYDLLDEYIDEDLVVAGVLLHDLAKVRDYERDGFAWTTSTQGQLVGHIAEVSTLIHDACMATLSSDDARQRLLHVVLAHHGKLEWGSPVKPALIEAMIVHMVDMLDSRCSMFVEAMDGLNVGEASGWIRPLRGRVIR